MFFGIMMMVFFFFTAFLVVRRVIGDSSGHRWWEVSLLGSGSALISFYAYHADDVLMMVTYGGVSVLSLFMSVISRNLVDTVVGVMSVFVPLLIVFGIGISSAVNSGWAGLVLIVVALLSLSFGLLSGRNGLVPVSGSSATSILFLGMSTWLHAGAETGLLIFFYLGMVVCVFSLVIYYVAFYLQVKMFAMSVNASALGSGSGISEDSIRAWAQKRIDDGEEAKKAWRKSSDDS